jgi:hypothetical protein
MQTNVAQLPKSDMQIADEIRTLIERLCGAMNEAQSRGIEANFNIARKDPTNPKSAFIVASITLTKQL